jgi:hypothetical protein
LTFGSVIADAPKEKNPKTEINPLGMSLPGHKAHPMTVGKKVRCKADIEQKVRSSM